MRQPKPLGKMQFLVKDCVFHRKVHILLNFTADDFTQWARRIGDKEYQRDGNADRNLAAFSSEIENDDGPTEWLICMKRFDWTIDDQGCLVHEIVHTVMKIFAMNHVPFVLETQEFIAHMVGNMYQDIAAKILGVKKS